MIAMTERMQADLHKWHAMHVNIRRRISSTVTEGN
jgi:hypothetical protein